MIDLPDVTAAIATLGQLDTSRSIFVDKLGDLWPEIAMLIGATLCLFTGLSRRAFVRRTMTPWIAGTTLVVAGLLTVLLEQVGSATPGLAVGGLQWFVKLAVAIWGFVLLLIAVNQPNQLQQNRLADASKSFEPGDGVRGEFFAFFLFSLTGVMFTADAGDLVWLFLALELTSLPTYVLVATSRDRIEAQESAVKYFFLGALAAAVFLYGFTLIYGAAGTTELAAIAEHVQIAGISPLMMAGLILAVLGICFKIAAFPMHFYAADVYQGAATPVTAFLAFVPKTAGFAALILLLATVQPLPGLLVVLLSAIAIVTMTLGNVLALLQQNVKRVLAYSSIAHSGYIMVGLIAGLAVEPDVLAGAAGGGGVMNNGIAAVLFYLVAYASGTIGSFAIFGCVQRDGREIESYDDIAGLRRRRPLLGWVLLVSVISLLGIPPLVGFVGKLTLLGSAFGAGLTVLVIAVVLNSAISAGYYLKIASVVFFGTSRHTLDDVPTVARRVGAAFAAFLAIGLGVGGNFLIDFAHDAVTAEPPSVVESIPEASPPTDADERG